MKILTFTAPQTQPLAVATRQALSAELRAFASEQAIVDAASLGLTSWQDLTDDIARFETAPNSILVCGSARELQSPEAVAFVQNLTARFPTTICAAFVPEPVSEETVALLQTGFFPVVSATAPANTLAESLHAAERLRARVSATNQQTTPPQRVKPEKGTSQPPQETPDLTIAVEQFRMAAVYVTCHKRELPNDSLISILLYILKSANGKPLPAAEISRLGLSLTGQGKNGRFCVGQAVKVSEKLLASFADASPARAVAFLHDARQKTYRLHDPQNAIRIEQRAEPAAPPRPITFFGVPLTFERPEHQKILAALMSKPGEMVDLDGFMKSRKAPFDHLSSAALYQEMRKIMQKLESLRPRDMASVYLEHDGTVYRLMGRVGVLKFAPSAEEAAAPHRPGETGASNTVFLYDKTPFTLDGELATILKTLISRPDTDIDLYGYVTAKRRNKGAPLGPASVYNAIRKIRDAVEAAKGQAGGMAFIGRSEAANGTTYYLYDPQGHITVAPAGTQLTSALHAPQIT